MKKFAKTLYCTLFIVLCSWLSAEQKLGVSWMRNIDDQVSISRISMPGTHDSGALHGGVFAECQKLAIKEQLEIGVRFLDIRCKRVRGKFQIFHGIADQKMSFEEVRDICEAFVKAHPTETLVMSIKDENSRGLKKGEFGALFLKAIKPKRELWYQKEAIPRLKEVRGKIVVVSRHSEVVGVPWKSFKIQDSYRVSGTKEIAAKWQKFLTHGKEAEKSKKEWYVNYASGTGLLSTPNVVAEKLNPKVLKLYQDAKPHYQGVIMLDFITKDLAESVIFLNASVSRE